MIDHARLRAVSEDGSITAEFVPDVGMVCCSLHHHGEERLDPRKGLEAYAQRGSTMGMPLLYPWANRLGAYTYEAAGKRVTLPEDPARIHQDANGLPIHGVAPAMMLWESPAGGDGTVLKARLEWSSPELLELFPYAHEVVLQASAEPGSLRIATTVRASANDRVPVSFGFHPYLRLAGADREAWSIELPRGRQLVLDDRQLPTGESRPVPTGPIALAGGDFDDCVKLADANSPKESDGGDSPGELAPPISPSFVATAPGRRIEVELIEGFGFGQVYSPRGAPFVCFEPMTAPADALRTGQGLRVLDPGEEHRAVFLLSFG